MFKKSILELHLKDKIFFLLVAIFAIGGLGLAVKTGVSYLTNSIKGHQKDTKNKVEKMSYKYGKLAENTFDGFNEGVNTGVDFIKKLEDWPKITLVSITIYYVVKTVMEILRGL